MTINERVFFALENQRFSQAQLAKYLEINRANVSRWKERKSDIPSKYIVGIADFLGVSVMYLLTGKEEVEENGADTRLLQLFHSMNEEGKEKALEQLEFFASKYKKHSVNKMVAE